MKTLLTTFSASWAGLEPEPCRSAAKRRSRRMSSFLTSRSDRACAIMRSGSIDTSAQNRASTSSRSAHSRSERWNMASTRDTHRATLSPAGRPRASRSDRIAEHLGEALQLLEPVSRGRRRAEQPGLLQLPHHGRIALERRRRVALEEDLVEREPRPLAARLDVLGRVAHELEPHRDPRRRHPELLDDD